MSYADSEEDEYELGKKEIAMRNIAHRILRYTGDSTSQVLPVTQIGSDYFQIPFPSRFTYSPDSLIRIIDHVIAENNISSNYIVSVLECGSDDVIYGYVFQESAKESLTPCQGRMQPMLQYCINIRFKELKNQQSIEKNIYIAGIGTFGLGLILVFGIRRFTRKKGAQKDDTTESNQFISIGIYQFDASEQELSLEGQTITLTVKETQLLTMLATSINKIIDRNQLQKIWEDEGVIVGRSLDMFISKLRKKLEGDPNVAIVNIHGKGYKLEIKNS